MYVISRDDREYSIELTISRFFGGETFTHFLSFSVVYRMWVVHIKALKYTCTNFLLP